MTGGQGAVVERLRAVLTSGDVQAADAVLEALAGDELREAKQWFGANERSVRRLVDDSVGRHEHQWFVRVHWIVGLCAIRLCGPRTAITRMPWDRLWTYGGGEAAEPLLMKRLLGQPEEWGAEFVDAGSRLAISDSSGAWTMSAMLRRVIDHHGLPCPEGATFLAHWLAGTRATDSPEGLAEWLSGDHLMPDLLWGFLAHGDCGRHPELPGALAILVAQGRVDRATIVESVLVQLTSGPRVGAQGVLVGILAALDVGPDEVSGGLGYLVGVLAASHRTVQPVLLPMAIELATDADDWQALVSLVSGRPEKKAKELVLAGLKAAAGAGQVGGDVLGTLLGDLGSGDDAAFAAKVDKVRTSLGVAPAAPAEPAPLLGLWDLEPVPQGGIARPPDWLVYPRRTPGWHDLLRPSFDRRDLVRPWLVETTLEAMAAGTYDGSEIVTAADERLASQEFLCSTMVTVAEELFLAGGLRQGWSTVLRVADLAAGAPKRPARLADLVRVLVRYAPEVREPGPLPTHLAALAAERGTSKAATEARALAALLGAPGPVAAEEPDAPGRRGLWDVAGDPLPTRPEDVRITDDPILARAADLEGLRALLSEDFNGWAQSFGDVCWWPTGYSAPMSLTGLTEPDRVLAAVVAAVGRHGADEVRESLGRIARQYGPVHVVAAIDCWAVGALDLAAFWRVATEPVVSESTLLDRWREQGGSPHDNNARRASLPAFADRLGQPVAPEHGALVVPYELHTPLSRFMFLRAAEALLRAEDEPVLLSTPTWRDGTLEAGDLLERLRLVAGGTGVVGPLDLVQALHRLRDADPRLADEVPDGLRTDQRFTDPEGREGLDATAMVREWFAAGGLPELVPAAADGRWHGRTTTPVPFTRLAAWPADLADDPWCLGPMPDALRLVPRWVDRCFEDAFQEWSLFDPRHIPSLAAGRYGVPFHDRLLALLMTVHNQSSFQGSPTLLVLARSGCLEPAAIAAAALGRHEAGTLSLTLLTRTIQRDLEAALPALWPLAMAIADALCGAARRPAALAELLRLLTSYAHEVPAEAAVVPPGILALAGAKGSTKAHHAARDLVTALRKVTP
ncbi:hypothetical protein J2X46_003712 [Nocardioides sp. BE266]|uniref:hypothetical protein n=1 Tax=Nocardioides sp. BE266 TaxID=2817725 RepID=UPI00285BEDF1|nr:hypothetical protein [Nocardioides sp. BE266]MDR7254714.1 hypothetical protein [Nocardioides sp. BE266]